MEKKLIDNRITQKPALYFGRLCDYEKFVDSQNKAEHELLKYVRGYRSCVIGLK